MYKEWTIYKKIINFNRSIPSSCKNSNNCQQRINVKPLLITLISTNQHKGKKFS